jgi:urease accessory protein
MKFKPSRLIAFTLACSTLGAQAHTGHGTHSLLAGLVHPFGADHLLAMIAVGIWSVSALPAGKAWQGPATFMLALVLGAIAGMMGLTLPGLEHAISLSVVLFGVMLILSGRSVSSAMGLGLIGFAAALHGLAHGVETTETGFAGYALGFLLTTAALHLGGVSIGLALKRWLAERRVLALRGLGLALGGSGLYLFSQL